MDTPFRGRPSKVPPNYNPIPDTFTPMPEQRRPKDGGKLPVRHQYYTDIKRMFHRKPTHTSLTKTDYDIAVATHSVYKDDPTRFLQSKGSPFKVIRRVGRNVMSLTNTLTGEDVVVVKGIKFGRRADFEDLATLSQFDVLTDNTTASKVYQEALAEARRIGADAVYGHSRGSNVAQMVGAELDIPSVGFNGYTSPQTLFNRVSGRVKSLHTEHSNLADPIGILNDISGISRNPHNFEMRTYAPVQGGSLKYQHNMSQFTEDTVRHPTHTFEAIDLMTATNKIGDISLAQMFHKGVKEGKTFKQILKDHENGFGILTEDGAIGVRGGRGSNVSEMFQAVGGRHTAAELQEMRSLPEGDYQPNRLSPEDMRAIRNGKGVQMIHDIHDTIADTHDLPKGTTWTAGSLARGTGGMLLAGAIGEGVASAVDKVSPFTGETENVAHSGVSFSVATGLLEGSASLGLGFVAGAAGEVARYGTEKLMNTIGVNASVAHNLAAFTSGATSGAVVGSALGPVGAAVGGLTGGVLGEAAYVITHYLPKLFH